MKFKLRAHQFQLNPNAEKEEVMVAIWHAGYLLSSMTWYDLGVTAEARQSRDALAVTVHPPSAICEWVGWLDGSDGSPSKMQRLIEQALGSG